MTEVYSADWVLPVDDAPIEHGGVAVADGRIVAVGPADELAGEKRGFADSVIVPGFVNAHTHLEYAAYAGFGDGLSDFSAWLAVHVERKRRLDWDDHVAIARLGAADCLASGVSTVGDCSFTGAAAVAAAELGLSGIVYLEVFGIRARRGAPKVRRAAGPGGLGDRRPAAAWYLAARAVQRVARRLPGMRRPRPADGNPRVRERGRAELPARRQRDRGRGSSS